ncbi:hypothetical protein NGA35_00555 [Pseudomonas stutzeri]|nr:hypothetical protein [Stutzerimonas stutzeri]
MLHQQAALPGVRQVRGVQPLHDAPAERQRLAVLERPRRAVGEIVDRHQRRHRAAQRYRLRGDGQPFVERAALVGLDVGQADVAQALDRQHAGHRLAHQREQPARAGVEQQRLVVEQQVLVEREAAALHPHRGVDAVDAVGDLDDVGARLRVGDGHGALLPVVAIPQLSRMSGRARAARRAHHPRDGNGLRMPSPALACASRGAGQPPTRLLPSACLEKFSAR